MKIKTVVIPCSIRCSKNARERMWLVVRAAEPRAISAEANAYVCLRCHQTWDCRDIAGSSDIENISCSNCYGDNVLMTSLRSDVPSEAWRKRLERDEP